MCIIGDLFRVGDFFDTYDEETIMSEYKAYWFFGQEGVSIFNSLYVLAIWFFFDKREYFAARAHACNKIYEVN